MTKESMADLMRRSFDEAWERLGARRTPDLAEFIARYAEPGRSYHSVAHLMDCLGWLERSESLAERPYEVRLALFYHDVICVPGASDNERRSAAFFRAHAESVELPDAPIERVARMIEGTANHEAEDADGALVIDIDLAVLGAPADEFARYEAGIREEYAFLDERLFRAGRERVLRSFLGRESIYQTRFFRERLERKARANLEGALRRLQEIEESKAA